MADKNRLYLKNRYATPVRKDLQVRGAKQTEIEQRIDLKAEKGEKSEQKNIEKKFLKISKNSYFMFNIRNIGSSNGWMCKRRIHV